MHPRIIPLVYRLFICAPLLSPLVPGAGVVVVRAQTAADPSRIILPPQSSQVFARDGSLIGEVGKEIRTNISFKTLPKYVGQAFVAVEDQRFYQHDGVDMVGIAGALKDAVMGDPRGASTITQQLVGNMHPGIVYRADKSISRKLREQQAARAMEKRYTKEQILEAYLNQIHFGHGWYGIEAAARHYFGKPASSLTLAETATLAAMPKGPAIYDPIKHPERTLTRRNTVLSLMSQQGYITRSQMQSAQAIPIKTAPNAGMSVYAPYFVDVVRVQAQRAGAQLNSFGYRIYTSLDPVMQRAANSSLREELAALEAKPGYKHVKYGAGKGDEYLQGVVVALDPNSGDVYALVGGRDYSESQFDRAVDGMRQPGSSFKPIVYAAAVAAGYSPTTMVGDTAISIRLENGTYYKPDNSDNDYMGLITLRNALAKSRNTVAVQLGVQLGMDSVIALAKRMGITAAIAPYPSSAIGASAVQPLDMIASYTTFANLGTPVEPRFIHRIEDRNGRVIYSAPVRALPPALDPRTAFVVRDMMRDVVERGTATNIRNYLSSDIPVAGKTGTTDRNSDVWFVGLTPDVVAGVWIGFDRPKTIAAGAAGGSLAAPVWGKMLSQYYAAKGTRPVMEWTPPIGVIPAEMDRATGQLATALTPLDRRYTEYFVEGTEPESLRADPWVAFKQGAIIF